jgi:hypothetical protein
MLPRHCSRAGQTPRVFADCVMARPLSQNAKNRIHLTPFSSLFFLYLDHHAVSFDAIFAPTVSSGLCVVCCGEIALKVAKSESKCTIFGCAGAFTSVPKASWTDGKPIFYLGELQFPRHGTTTACDVVCCGEIALKVDEVHHFWVCWGFDIVT